MGDPREAIGECAAAWSVTRRVVVDGCPIRFREAGRGPVVVLVHGLGVSADYWWRNGPALAAAGHRVLAPDLPGFGRTPGPERGLSVGAQAAWIRRWARVMELGPAVFVGHSLSCQSVLELAAAAPDRVSGVVLAAPTGARIRHRLLHQAWGLLRDLPRESIPLAVLVGQAYLRAGLPRVWRTWRMGADEDPLRVTPHVRAPILVVTGTRDPVVPEAFVRALVESAPRAEAVWVPGAAHAVIYNGAEAFNRAVLDFVRARVAPGEDAATG